jgi:cell wall-associated NlpC family hydrolase
LFFNTSGKGVSHVGVFIEGNQFVHASTSKGVIYSSTTEAYWTANFLGARRP